MNCNACVKSFAAAAVDNYTLDDYVLEHAVAARRSP